MRELLSSRWRQVLVLAIAAIVTFCIGFLFFSNANPSFPEAPSNGDSRPHGILLLVADPNQGQVTFKVTVNVTDGTYKIEAIGKLYNPFKSFMALEYGIDPAPMISPTAYSQSKPMVSPVAHIESVYAGNWMVAKDQGGALVPLDSPSTRSSYNESLDIQGLDGGIYEGVGFAGIGSADISCSSSLCPPATSLAGFLSRRIDSSSGQIITGELPLINAWGYARLQASRAGSGAAAMDLRLTSVQFSEPVGGAGITRAQSRWYVPAKAIVDISVEYDKHGMLTLPSRYRIDSAAPPTDDSEDLHWRINDLTQVSWTLTDLEGQRAVGNDLFYAGILLGAAFGFLGAAIERSFRGDRQAAPSRTTKAVSDKPG
jgi:hypothetical protein